MWGGNGVRPCRGAGWGQKLLGVRQAQGSIVQHGGQSHCSVITVTGKGPLKSYKFLKIKKFKNLYKERETIHPPFDFLSKDWRMPVQSQAGRSAFFGHGIQMLISSKNTLVDTPRNSASQLPGHSLAQISWHIKLTVTVLLITSSLSRPGEWGRDDEQERSETRRRGHVSSGEDLELGMRAQSTLSAKGSGPRHFLPVCSGGLCQRAPRPLFLKHP